MRSCAQSAEMREGAIRRYSVTPEDFGVSRAPLEAMRGGTPEDNAATIRHIFAGEAGPRRDVVVANAAAALVAAGVAATLKDAARLAGKAISSGAAEEKLVALRTFTNNSPD